MISHHEAHLRHVSLLLLTATLLASGSSLARGQTPEGAAGTVPAQAEVQSAQTEAQSTRTEVQSTQTEVQSAFRRAPTHLDAVLDSLRTTTRAKSRWNEFVTSTDWDSTAGDWIPDPEVDFRGRSPANRFDLTPIPRWRFNKVEGITPGAGIRIEWGRRPGLRLSGGMDRATGPGRWAGELTVSMQNDARNSNGPPPVARTRHGGGGPEGTESIFSRVRGGTPWNLHVSYAERALPFGSNRPLRNALKASLLSLDEQSYLRREERTLGVDLRPSDRLRVEIAYTKRKDHPLSSALDPLWNTDPRSWNNARADRIETNGVLLRARTELGFLRSLEVTARGGAFGGALGGAAEFYPLGTEVRQAFHPPGAEHLDLELWATTVLGRPPLQELADLGGASSLRAHAPGERRGRASALLRLDYVLRFDLLRRLRFPLARQLKLQPTAFLDVGAAWGDLDWLDSSDVHSPSASDWRTDIGVGIQRNMGYPGLLDRVRVDFGWRTDRSTDRFRATVRFIP